MTTVVLFGITGGYVADEIKRVLSHYGIIAVNGTSICQMGNKPRFLLAECSARAKIETDSGIIVMIGEIAESCKLSVPKGYRGIAYQSDTAALRVLMKNGIETVVCGMGEENSLMLSSIGENTASVCLQRKIVTLGGNTVEPCEFPVRLKNKITDYALLAAFGILLLSDTEPRDIEY